MMQSVMQEIARPAGDWTIRAVQERAFAGSPGWFDVFAVHRDGQRVPFGPNMHAQPDDELDRLEKLVDWPSDWASQKGNTDV